MNSLPDGSPFKNRKIGLVLFGVFEILGGLFCVLLVVLVIFGAVMSSHMTGNPSQMEGVSSAIVLYGSCAVLFTILGIGSILARRWARALSLVTAWAVLLTGLLTIAVLVKFLPAIVSAMDPPTSAAPQSARMAVFIGVFGVLGVLFVVVPGILILFYRSGHVRATCEALSPDPSWTDSCPLPVLGLSLLAVLGGIGSLLTLSIHKGVMPFFGTFLSGWGGRSAFLFLSAAYFYAAYRIYRLSAAGWWTVLIVILFFAASSLITFAQVDPFEMYRLMEYSEAQIESMRRIGMIQNGGIFWLVGLGIVPMLAYLLYVKRFFKKERAIGPLNI